MNNNNNNNNNNAPPDARPHAQYGAAFMVFALFRARFANAARRAACC